MARDLTRDFRTHVERLKHAVFLPGEGEPADVGAKPDRGPHQQILARVSELAREVREMFVAIVEVLKRRRSKSRLIAAAFGASRSAEAESEDQDFFKRCDAFRGSVTAELSELKGQVSRASEAGSLSEASHRVLWTILAIMYSRVEEVAVTVNEEKQHALTRSMNRLRSARFRARPLRRAEDGGRGGTQAGGAASVVASLRRRRKGAAAAAAGGTAAVIDRGPAAGGGDGDGDGRGGGGGGGAAPTEQERALEQERLELEERLERQTEDVLKVERSMAEISAMIQELTAHAQEQDVKIRTLDDNAQETHDNVSAANDHLEQAAQHSARFRVCMLVFLVSAGLLLLLLDALSP